MNKRTIILIFVVIALLAGAGVWKWKNEPQNINETQKQSEQNKNELDNLVTEKDPLVLEQVDTSNWKTYRNEEYGFEIRYPEDWIINSNDVARVTLNSPKNETTKNNIKEGTIYGEGYAEDISIYYYENILDETNNKINKFNAKTVEELMEKYQTISNQKKIILSEEKAWSMTEGGFSSYYTIMTIHANHFYKITFGNKEKEEDLSSEERGIVSSFKFIELKN